MDFGRAFVGGVGTHGEDAELFRIEEFFGGDGDECLGPALEPAVEPAEGRHLQVLRVLVRTFGDEQAELVGGLVQRVEAREFAVDAEHTVEGEDRVFVGVGEEERARGEQGGEFRVVPAIGIHHEHTVAVALDGAVDHVVVEIGDAGDGHGDLDAVVECGGVPRVGAATGATGHADLLGVDLGAGLEVVECADAVPRLHTSGRVAAGVPPKLTEAARAVMHALKFAQLDGVDGEADVAVTCEPCAMVLVAGFVSEARWAVFHNRVAADVEDGGRTAL